MCVPAIRLPRGPGSPEDQRSPGRQLSSLVPDGGRADPRSGTNMAGAPEEAKAMYRPLADDGIVRRIVAAAAAAPSIHNTQPWRFRIVGDDLMEVHSDP